MSATMHTLRLGLIVCFLGAATLVAQQPVTVVGTVQTQSNAANIATQTTLASMAADVASGVATNTQSRHISVGSSEDEFQVKGTPGVMAGVSATNASASTDAFLKCTNLTAANTTPGSSTVFYSVMVPHGAGIVDRNIEIAFSVALTCYLVTGAADNNATEVAADEVHVNVGYR